MKKFPCFPKQNFSLYKMANFFHQNMFKTPRKSKEEENNIAGLIYRARWTDSFIEFFKS